MIYYKDLDYNTIKEFALDPKNIIIEEKGKGEDKEIIKTSNIIFTFDCETTSYFLVDGKPELFNKKNSKEYYEKSKKQGLMYIWMVGINSVVVYGRDYEDLKVFMWKLHCIFKDIKIFMYVHNLSFDFQFLQNSMGTGFEVFARQSRKVLTAYSDIYNIEFRCSYFLTNKSLASLTEEYKLDIKKQSGLLDYNVLRTPLTYLNEDELKYCKYDILVMFEVLKKYRQNYNTVKNIPLTQTGKIRRQIKRLFFKDKKHHQLISAIAPSTVSEYKQLLDIYLGGYTHANRIHAGKYLKNVYSFDITSSYPFVMCVEKFPMTKFVKTRKKLNEIDRENYSYIIDVSFKEIESITSNSFLSVSKAKIVKNEDGVKILGKNIKSDNGRLISADSIRYELTDCDFEILCKTYKWKKDNGIKINAIYTAKKEYLPIKLVQYILELFELKTKYKGVKEFEELYREAKEFINSIYGMFVTKIISDDVEYGWKDNTLWRVEDLTKEEAIEKAQKKLDEFNEMKGQNLNFAWGVWVAAYGRRNLWNMIIKLGDDLVYSDTDSNKFLNVENCKYFEEYNKLVEKTVKKVCHDRFPDLTPEMFSPSTPKGDISYLGKWDFEGCYEDFVTLGAKKYAFTKYTKDKYEDEKMIIIKDIENTTDIKEKEKLQKKLDEFFYVNITLSGVNKKSGSKALKDITDFKVGFLFDYDTAGKMEAHYNDNQEECVFPDGYIDKGRYGICMKDTTYLLGVDEDYEELIDLRDARFLGGI